MSKDRNDINELREHLFATLRGVRDKENPMDIDRAKAVVLVADPVVQAEPAPPPTPPSRATRPTDDDIIATLALHYRVHELKVIEWLIDMDLDAAANRVVANL